MQYNTMQLYSQTKGKLIKLTLHCTIPNCAGLEKDAEVVYPNYSPQVRSFSPLLRSASPLSGATHSPLTPPTEPLFHPPLTPPLHPQYHQTWQTKSNHEIISSLSTSSGQNLGFPYNLFDHVLWHLIQVMTAITIQHQRKVYLLFKKMKTIIILQTK